MQPVAWTRPDDVRAALRRKWRSGALLTAFATAPTGSRWVSRCAARVQARSAAASAKSRTGRGSGNGPGRVNCGPSTRGSAAGASDLTSSRAAWIDSYRRRGTARCATRGAPVHRAGRSHQGQLPPAGSLVAATPSRFLQLSAVWEQFLGTVRSIDEPQQPGMYLGRWTCLVSTASSSKAVAGPHPATRPAA